MQNLWKHVESARGGHDADHIRRVYRWARRIADGEDGPIDREILFAAVILHDIARDDEDRDPTGKTDHALLGGVRAEEILLSEGWRPDRAALVRACVETHRYSSERAPPASIEGRILFDADKLDCLGAVGVARLFMLAGQFGERLYVTPPEGWGEGARVFRIGELSEYSANLEFTGKMRFVPQRLLTASARRLAGPLLQKMEAFFASLEEEIL